MRHYFLSLKFSLVLMLAALFLISCDQDEKSDYQVDFKYEEIDENNIRFVNESEGEYYSLSWDFGNGKTEVTTNKAEQYEIYYPTAGEYTVKLSALDYSGGKKEKTETIVISNSDFEISFTATINSNKPNEVTLVNTSVGDVTSFKWLFRDKVIENESTTVAYFPYRGNYEITFEAKQGDEVFTETKTIHIARDDPNYSTDYTLVWSDEFNGSNINTSDWTFETGAGGWGNQELQNYTNGDNATIVDGKLVLTAKKVNNNKVAGSYTSTRMITMGKKEFTYGKIEVSAKLPSGTGIWPAIWMLGGNINSVSWPACGEIDIMEYVGFEPDVVHGTVHTPAGYGANGNGSSKSLTTAEEEFHTYGILWTEQSIKFYVDTPDNLVHTYNPNTKTADNWPFDKPHFFIFNIAVGGTWGGAQGIDNAIFPQTMEIDYVRVYQIEE